MKLDHLDIQVPNVPETAAFLEQHFGFQIVTNRNSTALVVLHDSDGFVLVLQRLEDPSEKYPEGFHIGFHVDHVSRVHEHHARLTAAGVEFGEIISNNRGEMFYLYGPGRVLIEVSCPKPLKAVAAQRAG